MVNHAPWLMFPSEGGNKRPAGAVDGADATSTVLLVGAAKPMPPLTLKKKRLIPQGDPPRAEFPQPAIMPEYTENDVRLLLPLIHSARAAYAQKDLTLPQVLQILQ